jgi:hypothetical protein
MDKKSSFDAGVVAGLEKIAITTDPREIHFIPRFGESREEQESPAAQEQKRAHPQNLNG